ncbi:MAG TPA: CopD family protein [Verrucomicrobiae bacterium]|jgi:putative copper resistance protein D|nr:CopD family protein [Verrucomicrobiae bacterium]
MPASLNAWFILARAVHYGACLIFFGIFAFDRFVAAAVATEAAAYWKSCMRRFSLVLLPLIFISGIGWFVCVAATMSGQSPEMETLKSVWTQTQFGDVWKTRWIFWFAASAAAICQSFELPASFQKILIWLQLVFSGVILGSLAWTGHGLEGSAGHLIADVLHLLVAGFWPAGLLPFTLLLRKLVQPSAIASGDSISTLIRRFSAWSLASVVLLAATGFVNSWFLVGSLSDFIDHPYGRWLLAKIILFVFTVVLGAVNLLRLKPRLTMKTPNSPAAAAAISGLQLNVRCELFLSTLIIIVVAILGMLPPTFR